MSRVTVNRKGYSAIAYVYDNAGNTLQVRYLDEQDNLTRLPEGFSVWQREYDAHNHVTVEQYLDENERIASLTDRIASTRRAYDGRGNLVRVEFLNAGAAAGGDARWATPPSSTPTTQDRRISETYLNANGLPTTISAGYAGIRYEYSDQGKVWRTTYVDTSGQPTLFKDGYAATEYTYDENQYVRRDPSTWTTTTPHLHQRRLLRAGRTVDKNGSILTETYLDLEDTPVACTAGYATQRNTWDDQTADQARIPGRRGPARTSWPAATAPWATPTTTQQQDPAEPITTRRAS